MPSLRLSRLDRDLNLTVLTSKLLGLSRLGYRANQANSRFYACRHHARNESLY